MTVRRIYILFLPLLVVGCATQHPVAVQTHQTVVIAAAMPTKLVETRYDVRGYREAENPAVRHEAHAVYRSTRVPIDASDELATVSRTSYPPVSVAPLPASAELNAELATQKAITAEARAVHASLLETEQRMQAQYATLVRQTAEAQKVREQLEAERARIRSTPATGVVAVTPAATGGNSAEVKW